MKHQAFTDIVARITRVPENTVAMFVRNLKSGGLLTSGARGVNAPEMTILDLTRVVVALCATDRPAHAVDAANFYRSAKVKTTADIEMLGEFVCTVNEGDTLEEVLLDFLSWPTSVLKYLDPNLEIDLSKPSAVIKTRDGRFVFECGPTADEKEELGHKFITGIKTIRVLSGNDLTAMALPFGLERESGATWEEMRDSGTALETAKRHLLDGQNEGM